MAALVLVASLVAGASADAHQADRCVCRAASCTLKDNFRGGFRQWNIHVGGARIRHAGGRHGARLTTPRRGRRAFVGRPLGRAVQTTTSFGVRFGARGRSRVLALGGSGVQVGRDRHARLFLKAGRQTRRLTVLPSGKWARVSLSTRSDRRFASIRVGRRHARVRTTKRPSSSLRIGRLAGRPAVTLRDLRLTYRVAGCPTTTERTRSTTRPTTRRDPSCCMPKNLAPAAAPRWFAANSFWNRPLAASAPLDAMSGAWVGELRRQLTTADPWINTTQYSTPIYTVGATQPRVHVTVDPRGGQPANPTLQGQFDSVPIPANAQAAQGTDQHMVVWQPSTDTMWEFWIARRRADGWHAVWGGRMDHVSSNPGHFTGSLGATATGLPLVGGLITTDELRRGRVDHALALAIPETQSWWKWSAPAQRSDGNSASPNAIPEGARFRLDPSLDIASLGLPRTTRIIAEAAQRYGIVIRDKSGAVSFYAEDPTPTGSNPYPALFGTWPNRLFDRFPWARLQALKSDMQHQ